LLDRFLPSILPISTTASTPEALIIPIGGLIELAFSPPTVARCAFHVGNIKVVFGPSASTAIAEVTLLANSILTKGCISCIGISTAATLILATDDSLNGNLIAIIS